MKKKKTKIAVMVGIGVLCLLLVLLASWYAVVYNESRLVVPMNLSEYEFCVRDLPMIGSISLACLYVCSLFILGIRAAAQTEREARKQQMTRKISPKLGFLGFFGFFGFLGFWTYQIDKSVYPFAFFLFFGFFGFYYEGKMSNTYMDERYLENKNKANLKAYKISLSIIYAALIIAGQGKLMGRADYTLIAFIIVIALSMALALFLSEYLLYRYDHDDMSESEE
ncbi:MAG: DUF3796 domain-containing protein [Eubacterium sp.]|nr:DUF3796 domain-containing protein [Eubacterium sp.]